MKKIQDALYYFSRTPQKHPMAKMLLGRLLGNPGLYRRIVFVNDRTGLADSMLFSELGSSKLGFHYSEGGREREEVQIMNGQLVRHTKHTYEYETTEPMEAWDKIITRKGPLYIMFSFCGPKPQWWLDVVQPNPYTLQKSQRQKSLTDAIRELKLQTIRLLLEQDWKCPNAVQSFLDLASDEYLDIVVFVDSSMDIDSDVDFHLRLMSPNVLYTPYVEYGGGTRNYQTGLDELIEREYRRFCISANFGSDSIPAWWQQAIGNDEKSKDGPDITYEDGSTTSTIEVESALLYIALNQALERRDFPRAKELSSELSRLHTPKEVVV